ncbi:ATP-binding cassette domain-containing protein [Candidatus Beckwithbacteria bacterium]|nr:ATP-binding cassette domain-containing protein [Candidatus Beckwithbacteria bacterium]
MTAISVSHLQKTFKVHEKEPGISGSVKSLFKRKYRLVKAVDDISFSIDAGELIGFIGPNGAGKTTTLKTLSGLLYPDGGKIEVLGFTPFERKHDFLKQIALVMGQKNQLWWDLPAMESFLLNKEIYEIPEEKFKKTLNNLVDMLDVSKVLNVQVRKLSLGQRMKCELIAALLHSPKVLFLDEPTIGLDVVMQKKMRHFIKEYNETFGATIILTSHYMEDVKKLCKRIIIIDHGQIIFDGNFAEIIKKYADHKILEIFLSKEVLEADLAKFGTVKKYRNNRAIIMAPRKQILQTAAALLKKLPVEDINIDEPAIEDVIREIFSGSDEA